MGAFTRTYEYSRNGQPRTTRELTGLGKVATLLATLGAGYLAIADSRMDILGDSKHPASKEKAEQIAEDRYTAAYAKASPAAKFMLQYGAITTVSTIDSLEGGNGIAAALEGDSRKLIVKINNACLKNTAYDVNGGTISGEFKGLFSSGRVRGDALTAAAFATVDSANSDRLTVKSGNTNSVDLHFSGVVDGTELTPADAETQTILDTYGCQTGVMEVFSGHAQSDPYVR